ncbi:hypothetical protein RMSM_07679 [Rhodopirellula maiorica SM1]|uniref:Uncharacterized protein n=1 Tax=Rhodopirellula maiorica SM1 TaxID=1265738 RepID=M5R8M8_9BACT|nr:hypothetical protein [Rhodopirellula maiorica]EMI15401.1 hypothetical protein RMSM_07679 [Rhodopirellula maiorica SM1]
MAKARIDRNNFDKARETLRTIAERRTASGTESAASVDATASSDDRPLPWEYRWLLRQVSPSRSTLETAAPVVSLATDQSGRIAVAVLSDGTIVRSVLNNASEFVSQQPQRISSGSVVAVAISADAKQIALGMASGDIELWDASLQKSIGKLHGHTRAVSDMRFFGDTMLVSGSDDRTVRLWDMQSKTEQLDCWHITPVRQLDIAAEPGGASWLLAVASADASSGHIAVWRVRNTNNQWKTEGPGIFDHHGSPVSSVALARDGRLAASGDEQGRVLIWRPHTVTPIDYDAAISSAIQDIESAETQTSWGVPVNRSQPFTSVALSDPAFRPSSQKQADEPEYDSLALDPIEAAHRDVVRAIEFSYDGNKILTAADDYTIKLWQTQSRDLDLSLRGHGGWVTEAMFLNDQTDQILSSSMDRSLRTWKPQSYVGDSVATHLVAKSSDAASTADTPAAATRGLTRRQAHADEIWACRFSPDGKRLVTSSRDRTAKVLQIDSETLDLKAIGSVITDTTDNDRTTLREGTTSIVMSLAVDATRRRLYVGGADAVIRVWDIDRGTELGELLGTGLNQSFALSKSGKYVLTGSSSPEHKGWLFEVNLNGRAAPTRVYPLDKHTEAITAFAISDDDARLFTADRAGRGFVWDRESGQVIGKPIDLLLGNRINDARFTPDGKHILVASDDQLLSVFDLESRTRVGQMSHDGFVTSVSLSADGKFALTLSELTTQDRLQTSVHLWDLASGQGRQLQQSVLERSKRERANERSASKDTRSDQRIGSVAFADAGNTAMVTVVSRSNQPTRVDAWTIGPDLESATRTTSMELPAELAAAAAIKPIDDERFISLNGDGAFLWDVPKGTHVRSFRANAAVVQSSFSCDGNYIATGSRSIKIWHGETLQPLGKLEVAHDGPVRSVEFAQQHHHDGTPDYRLVSGGDDGFVRLWRWDPQTQQVSPLSEFEFGVPVRSVTFVADGSSLLACGAGGVAKLWKIESATNPHVFQRADSGNFVCVTASDDGRWIAAGSTESVAYLWQVPEPHQPLRAPIELRGHSQRVEDIAILQDASGEMRVFTAGEDQTVRVWDPRIDRFDRSEMASDENFSDAYLARELLLLEQHGSSVTAVDLTASGELLMTASRDGTVILWPAEITPR